MRGKIRVSTKISNKEIEGTVSVARSWSMTRKRTKIAERGFGVWILSASSRSRCCEAGVVVEANLDDGCFESHVDCRHQNRKLMSDMDDKR